MSVIDESISRLNRLHEKVKQEHWESTIAKNSCLRGIQIAIAKLIQYRDELVKGSPE